MQKHRIHGPERDGLLYLLGRTYLQLSERLHSIGWTALAVYPSWTGVDSLWNEIRMGNLCVQGKTALHLAAENDNKRAVLALIAAGSNITAQDVSWILLCVRGA